MEETCDMLIFVYLRKYSMDKKRLHVLSFTSLEIASEIDLGTINYLLGIKAIHTR